MLAALIISCIFFFHDSWVKLRKSRTSPDLLVLLAGPFFGVVVAAICRPDLDDCIYAANAVWSFENPGDLLPTGPYWISNLTPTSDALITPYYELTLAATANLLGFPLFLDLYHKIIPLIAGTLIGYVWLLALGRQEDSFSRLLLGTLFVLLILLLMGETHRTPGNTLIARIHQGKFLFLSLTVPTWIQLSLCFLDNGKLRQWGALAVVGGAAIGLSTTSLVFLPLLSLMLALSYCWTSPLKMATVRRTATYSLSLFPVLAAALHFRETALRKIPSGSAINRGFSADFWDQAGYLINPDAPLTPILFGLSVLILTLKARKYRFHLTWIALTVLLLLNPWVSPAVMTHLTTENIYWRLFYLLPFPLIVGIAWLSLFQMGSLGAHVARGLLILVALGALLSPTSVLRPESGNQLRFGYRIPEALLLRCNQLKESLPAGSMLAPEDLAGNLVLLSAKFPQTYVREDYLRFVMTQAGDEEGLADRLAAAHLLYGPMPEANRPEALQRFLRLLQGSARPRYILVHDARLEDPEIKDVLTRAAYHVHMRTEGQWVVLAQEDPR